MKKQLFITLGIIIILGCVSVCMRNPNPKLKVDIAPEIELISPSGKTVKLSKLRGKMVLIDFWASWCGPCRMENPNVVEAYLKYKKEAIKTDKLIWKNHGCDKEGKASEAYNVSSIPSGFLIDGEGKIVAQGGQLRGLNLHIAIEKQLN